MKWYNVPFAIGGKYRIEKPLSYLGHNFAEGEVVEFTGDSYDAKQGLIRFWFKDCESGDAKAWHVWDDVPKATEAWQGHFARIEG